MQEITKVESLGGGKFKVAFSGNTSTVNITAGYVAIGTPGSEVTKFTVDGSTGVINMVANNEIRLNSGKTLTLTSSGSVVIGNSGKPFTVGSNGTKAYIYNGPTGIDVATDGVYLGTDGIYIRGTSGSTVNYVKATSAGVVDISGKITATEGSIGGWTLGTDYIGNNTTRDTSTIGLAKLSSGIVLWAGGSRTGSGNNAPKFSVQADGTVYAVKGTVGGWYLGTDYIGNANTKNGSTVGLANATGTNIVFWAGGAYNGTGTNAPEFSVKADGTLSATGATIKGTIKADTLYIGGTQADISLDNNGHITMSSIGGSLSVKLSEVDFDHLGTQAASYLYMTPTLFQVGTNASGVTINDNGVSVNGNKAINLDVNANNYVHMSTDGIEMKGNRVVIIDASTSEKTDIWARDDIIVMNPYETREGKTWRQTVAGIETHMAGKTDWVLIQPYYNVTLSFTHGGMEYYPSSSGTYDALAQKYVLTSSDATPYFGNGAQQYFYKVSFTAAQQTGTSMNTYRYIVMSLITRNNSTGQETSYQFLHNVGQTSGNVDIIEGVSDVSSDQTWFYMTLNGTSPVNVSLTLKSNQNLCADGYSLYFYFLDKTGGTNLTLTNIRLDASCAATKNKVPCTVYYYSP